MWVPTDTKRVRRKYTRFSNKGPPLSAFRMYGSPKDEKMLLKPRTHKDGLCNLSLDSGLWLLDPIEGEYPLEFPLNRFFSTFWNPYILEADNGGSLFKYFVHFLESHVARYCFFHFIC